jgi:pyruvate dehydrogenase complex dehydrogenase (E1) component
MWRRVGKLCFGTAAVATVGYWAVGGQQRENIYGAYRSIVNSSRAAIILYRAVKDYELSLMGL